MQNASHTPPKDVNKLEHDKMHVPIESKYLPFSNITILKAEGFL